MYSLPPAPSARALFQVVLSVSLIRPAITMHLCSCGTVAGLGLALSRPLTMRVVGEGSLYLLRQVVSAHAEELATQK